MLQCQRTQPGHCYYTSRLQRLVVAEVRRCSIPKLSRGRRKHPPPNPSSSSLKPAWRFFISMVMTACFMKVGKFSRARNGLLGLTFVFAVESRCPKSPYYPHFLGYSNQRDALVRQGHSTFNGCSTLWPGIHIAQTDSQTRMGRRYNAAAHELLAHPGFVQTEPRTRRHGIEYR